jgi:hypothetical protein
VTCERGGKLSHGAACLASHGGRGSRNPGRRIRRVA